ncbi:MAG: autotransporter-associated beta strand repeat-containing protein [Planctomycetes bacterium]|nr:autotransporter-associated beta strand repeat-containing protein [Planctomycetota bacterium]
MHYNIVEKIPPLPEGVTKMVVFQSTQIWHTRLWRNLLVRIAAIACLLAPISAAQATSLTLYWDNTGSPGSLNASGFGTAGNTWGSVARWSASSVGTDPTGITNTDATDFLNFGSSTHGLAGTGPVAVTGAAQGFSTLTFASTSGAITVSGGTSLTMGATSTITVDNAADTISTPLVGAATSFTKAGTGTLTLSGNNSYTGTTIINASGGTLRLGNANALGTTAGGTTVNSGGVLDLNNQAIGAEAVSLDGTGISSSGALINSGNAAANLSGAITLNAATTIAQTNAAGSLTLSGNITNGANTLTVGNGVAGTVTLSGALGSGAGGLSMTANSGTLNLNGNNTYTGLTTINSGSTIKLGHASALGNTSSGTTVSSGGVLDLNNQAIGAEGVGLSGTGISSSGALINSGNSAASLSGAITLNAATTIAQTNAAGSLTLSGNITNGANTLTVGNGVAGTVTLSGALGSGAGGLSMTANSGTLNLNGNNTYTGLTTINSGSTIKLGHASALGNTSSATTVSSGGVLDLNNQAIGAEGVGLSGTGISSSGALINSGNAAASLSGAITLNAATTLSQTNAAGSLTLTGNITNGNNDLTIGNGVAGTVTLNGVLGTGNGELALAANSGTLNLNGNNSFTGLTTIGSGSTLKVGHASALGGTGTGTTVSSGGVLDLNGKTLGLENILFGGTGIGGGGAVINSDTVNTASITGRVGNTNANSSFGGAGNMIFSGGLGGGTGSSSSHIIKTGAGTVTIGNVPAQNRGNGSATTTIDGGVLRIQHNDALSTVNSPTVTINNTGVLELNNTITLNLPLAMNNGSKLRSDGSNTSQGKITMSVAAGAQVVTIATVNGSDVFTIGNANNDVSGGNGTDDVIQITGPGSVRFGFSNDYIGNWSLEAGTTQLGDTAALGAVPARSITLAAGATLAGRLSVGSTFTANPITISGSGTATIQHDRSTVGNGVTYTFGNLSVGSQTLAVNSVSDGNVNNNTPYGISLGATTLSGNSVFDVANNGTSLGLGTLTLASISSPAGTSLTKNGNGALTITAVAPSIASLIYNAGALNLSGTVTIGSNTQTAITMRDTTLNNNITLIGAFAGDNFVFDATNNGTASLGGTVDIGNRATTWNIGNGSATTDMQIVGGVIGAGGSVTKTGAGLLLLSGSNSYTGLTQVLAGTLAESSTGLISDSSALTVNGATAVFDLGSNHSDTVATVTLDGDGLIAGTGTSALTVNSTNTFEMKSGTASAILAGTAALNKTTAGTVTLSGNNTYTGATTISGGTLKLGAAGNATNAPLGTIAAGTTVSATGAALDLSGFTLGTAEALTLNGTGVSSGGALTNSSATSAAYSGLITLGSASSIKASSGNIIISNTGTITGSGFGLTLDGAASGSSLASIIGTGTGTVTKNGTGTWTLSAANTYTGLTQVLAGTLAESSTGLISDSSALTVNGATAIFDLGANHSDTVAQVTLDGGGQITGSGSSALTSTVSFEMKFGNVSAILAGSGINLNKTTAGLVTLSGANSYSGDTSIGVGTLALSHATSNNIVNSPIINVGGGAQLDVTGLGGGAGLVMGSGQTLKGSGTILGDIVINGFHKPGNSPGIETFMGDYTLNGDLEVEILGSTPGPTGYDQVLVAYDDPPVDYNVTLGPTSTLTHVFSGGGWSTATDMLWIILNETDGTLSGVFSNYATHGMLVANYDSRNWKIYYGADFDTQSTSGGNDIVIAVEEVPEPTTFLLAAVGLIGLGVLPWRRRGPIYQRHFG